MNIFKRSICAVMALFWGAMVWAVSLDSHVTKLDSTLISTIGAFLGVLVGSFVTYWATKRKQFSSLITSERLEFIKDWREYSTKFCELLTETNERTFEDAQKYSIEYYYYKLIFMCNPTKPEAYIDQEVVAILELLYNLHQELLMDPNSDKEDVRSRLGQAQKQFLSLMQANIAIEWQGITAESQKGHLSDEQKEDLRQTHYKNYLKYIKK